ncbi:MAG: hypothetical protein ACC612_11305 [Methanomethylovorans sp.]|uniref:hypothetical protein n=1 Tax=Methanomethylovorans sp. TaxID=2758717 RepID=UPI0035305B50
MSLTFREMVVKDGDQVPVPGCMASEFVLMERNGVTIAKWLEYDPANPLTAKGVKA